MHHWVIDAREYGRHEDRRGRRHAYGAGQAERAALVVIDMVDHFVTTDSTAAGVVPRVNRAADRLRRAGGVVAWVVPASGEPTEWQRQFFGEPVAHRYAASGGDGLPVDRVADVMATRPDDLFVEKSAPSAFFPGRCDLDPLLAAQGVERVLIAGTVTSVCCESSARDAATLGYETIVLADCTADVSDESHNAALRTLYRSFADVRTADEALQLLNC